MQCNLCDGVALTVVGTKGFCKNHKENGIKANNKARFEQLSRRAIGNDTPVNTEEIQWKNKNKGKKFDVVRHTL
jgi:hypothetical protein